MCILQIFFVGFVGYGRPKKESPDRYGDRRIHLLGGNDGIFVVDKRIGMGAGRIDQGEPLVRWRPRGERCRRRLNRLRRWEQKLRRIAF